MVIYLCSKQSISFRLLTDATVKESLELKVFNPNFKISDVKMLELLNKTDLERYGYKKEVTTKLVSGPGSDKPQYHKSYFYYKIVDCSRLREIDQELQTLLPGKILIKPSEIASIEYFEKNNENEVLNFVE